ncbi:hypothetical protein NC653_001993 [Populus alba x Populus x berolinensis]|uniref:Uncharacterized protein n=1 Tax=Populus alba x Populus x berolinensis TaxID=444605 RepID=A0AAD6WG93_9ROSI|nr:hypothetical protein NC653_001993 [Populus alba x Populus x berolinensis]
MDSCDYAHGKWFWLQFYFMLSMATNVLESEWLAWEVSGCQLPFKFSVIHVHVVWKSVYKHVESRRRGVASDIDEPYNLHLAYRVFCWLLTFYPKLQKVLKSSHFAATGGLL